MRISFTNFSHITPKNATTIKNSRNPVELYKMMKMYSKERKDRFPYFEAALNSLNSILNNCKMRIIKDEFGNLLAAYTYKLRKNRLEQKSMFIDALVRNRTNPQSKQLMTDVYQDMKQIAAKKKAQELTLYSVSNDKALRAKYEKLGFKKDESVQITGGYIMRVKTPDFSPPKTRVGQKKS